MFLGERPAREVFASARRCRRKRRSGVVEAAVKILVVREVLFVVLLGVVYYLAVGRNKQIGQVVAPEGDDAPLVV